MKLRLVLADTDEEYLDKFVECVREYYADEIEIASFTEVIELKNYLAAEKVDMVLYSAVFQGVIMQTPSILLVEDDQMNLGEDIQVICKYRKSSDIYKRIVQEVEKHVQ